MQTRNQPTEETGWEDVLEPLDLFCSHPTNPMSFLEARRLEFVWGGIMGHKQRVQLWFHGRTGIGIPLSLSLPPLSPFPFVRVGERGKGRGDSKKGSHWLALCLTVWQGGTFRQPGDWTD
jgi:hypothetical protein